jgi:hypothetical protein
MNTQLQHAMAFVKAEPNNPDAWFSLSQVVGSEKEQLKLLRKVLALNANHQEAKEQLARLTQPAAPVAVSATIVEVVQADPEMAAEATAAPMPVSTNPLDFLAQAEADTIPPWMAGDGAALAPPRPAADPAQATPKESVPLPSWLAEEPSQDWLDKDDGKTGQVVWKASQENGSQEQAATPPPPAPAKPAKVPQSGSFATSNLILGILIVAAVLVFLAIVFVIIRM